MVKKDYCTKSPEKILDINISECCKIHDEDYEKQIGKIKADFKLLKCILSKGLILTSFLYYLFVSLLGNKYYKRAKMKK